MVTKKYYKVDELNKRFDVTFDDIRYWVESTNVNLAFYINNKRFVLGGWQKDKGFIGFAIATYSGLVSLSGTEQLELINKSKVKCRNVQLLNKAAITNLILDYPFKSPIPNKLIAEWRPKSIDQIIWDVVPAKVYPIETTSNAKLISQSILSSLQSISKKSIKDTAVDTSTIDNLPDYQFEYKALEFSTSDICISHSQLVKLGVLGRGTPAQTSNILQVDNATKGRTSDFHDLLKRILIENPSLSTKQIWLVLEKDFQLAEGERYFDTQNIIRDISANEILWVSRYQNSNYCKFSSLASVLSKIRKIL